MKNKFVYFFSKKQSEGNKEMKNLLGGKGAGLAEMASIGLPVPAGFTITTEVCDLYYKNNRRYPAGLDREVDDNMRKLERETGKKFGDPSDPLLVSVRSGAPLSMPGMMETILNLGLNDRSVEGLAAKTGNRRFALDAYRRFIMMYGSTAKGIEREEFSHAFEMLKNGRTRQRLGLAPHLKVNDTDVNESELQALVEEFKAIYKRNIGRDFPQEPREQLWGSVDAVFGSWMAEKAVTYRRVEKIQGVIGTAVNVQQMVFGNMGPKSGTGVCFTRDPNSGENIFYGDYLVNAQGEDVVAGIRTPIKLSEFEDADPVSYKQLVDVRRILERHFKDMQDLEFTVEEGRLYMLQCRTGKRSPAAAFRIAVDMAGEKLIRREDAILRIKDKDIEGIFYPIIDPDQKEEMRKNYLVSGIDAVPGAASGKVVFNARDAEAAAAHGEKVILVRKETSPEDVGGMHAAQGILTATGGKTSHAAVVARGWGKCCIVGCEKLNINYEKEEMAVGDAVVRKGEEITLNGSDRPGLPRRTAPDQARASRGVQDADGLGGPGARHPRAHQRRHPLRRGQGRRARRRGHRPVPHRTHVLRHRGAPPGHPGDDRGRHPAGPRRGAEPAAPLPEAGLQGHLQGHERLPGHHPPHRPAAARVRPPHRGEADPAGGQDRGPL